MSQSYSDLEGGWGHAIFYRAPRFKLQTLFGSESAKVQVLVGEAKARFCDVSMSGVSCQFALDEPVPAIGTVLPLQITVRDETAFAARAQVVRTQSGVSTRVAFRFLDSVFEPSRLQRIHSEIKFKEALDLGMTAYDHVPQDYKHAASEVALFLRHWQRVLDAREGSDSGDERSWEERAEARMRSEWASLRLQAAIAASGAFESAAALAATKLYTETLLTPLFCVAPIWRRAYRKPLGYPGDFQLMNYMYDSDRLGDSMFARVLHQLGKEERLAATVTARKDLLIQYISDAVGQAGGTNSSRQVRIASIGAGPAREVEEFLSASEFEPRVLFSLIDQDEDALAFANERTRRAGLRHEGQVDIRCRYISFGQLLGKPSLLAEFNDHDLVYSAGLFDYLSDDVARRLVHALFALLRVDGSLVIGNALDEPEAKWVPEYVLDWRMIYRTEEQMRDLALGLEGAAKVEVVQDRCGAWQFLILRRTQ